MVRSKEVHKKPKDPLMTPPPSSAKKRGFRDDGGGGGGGSRPRNREGAATSLTPASVPNYMRGRAAPTPRSGAGRRRRRRRGGGRCGWWRGEGAVPEGVGRRRRAASAGWAGRRARRR